MGGLQGEPLDWGITWGTSPNKTTISIQTAFVGRGFGLIEQNRHHAGRGEAALREPGFVPWERGGCFQDIQGQRRVHGARDQRQSPGEPRAPEHIRRPRTDPERARIWIFVVFF